MTMTSNTDIQALIEAGLETARAIRSNQSVGLVDAVRIEALAVALSALSGETETECDGFCDGGDGVFVCGTDKDDAESTARFEAENFGGTVYKRPVSWSWIEVTK